MKVSFNETVHGFDAEEPSDRAMMREELEQRISEKEMPKSEFRRRMDKIPARYFIYLREKRNAADLLLLWNLSTIYDEAEEIAKLMRKPLKEVRRLIKQLETHEERFPEHSDLRAALRSLAVVCLLCCAVFLLVKEIRASQRAEETRFALAQTLILEERLQLQDEWLQIEIVASRLGRLERLDDRVSWLCGDALVRARTERRLSKVERALSAVEDIEEMADQLEELRGY